MKLKIALSGAGGSGKGTLGTLLSETYGLPLLGSPNVSVGLDLEMAHYRDADKTRGLVYQHACLYSLLFQERGCLAAGSGFIGERSSLDYIPYYLDRDLPKMSRYEAIAIEHAAQYDHIFFLPADFTPGDKSSATWKERSETDRRRTDGFIWSLVQSSVVPGKRTRLNGTLQQRFDQACCVINSLCPPHPNSLASSVA